MIIPYLKKYGNLFITLLWSINLMTAKAIKFRVGTITGKLHKAANIIFYHILQTGITYTNKAFSILFKFF